ncbi:MAG: hypothetical protein ACRDCC_11390 [Culicoidibacterales bacterium]
MMVEMEYVLKMNYTIWRMNRFDAEMKQDLVGRFIDLEHAKDFVDYQMTIGEEFAVFENNIKIYPDEF